MSKLSFLPGNSQKPPERGLSAADAPVVGKEIYDGDNEILEIYDLVLRMQMSRTAINGTQNNYTESHTAQVNDATARFQARAAIANSQQMTGDTHVQEAA